MVFAPPRLRTATGAWNAKRAASPGYQAALDALPRHHAEAVREYVAAVHAEAAAHRNEARRARADLEARISGDHHNEGEQP